MRRFLTGVLLGIVVGAGAAAALLRPQPSRTAERPDGDRPGPSPAAGAGRDGPVVPASSRGPEPTGRPWPREDWTDPALLAELSRVADGTGADAEERVRRVARIIKDRGSPPIPAVVFLRLLDAESAAVRSAAVELAALVRPAPVDRLVALATSDPETGIRSGAAAALGRLALADAGVADRIRSLAEDPRAPAREAAVLAAREVQGRLVELSSVVLLALEDPDLRVRSAAIDGLSGAGSEGAEAALALLRSGNHEPQHVLPLAAAIVSAGRFEEALGDVRRAEIVTAIVRELASRLTDEELPDSVRGLAGKFAQLLPLYRPAEARDYAAFFRLAIHAEETELVRSVVLSTERDDAVRRGALVALLGYEPSRSLGIDVSETLLLDEPAPPVLRVEIVRLLAPWRHEDEPCGQRIFALLERVAREDENDWVREAARPLVE